MSKLQELQAQQAAIEKAIAEEKNIESDAYKARVSDKNSMMN